MSYSKINNCVILDTNVIISSLLTKHANAATKICVRKALDDDHYMLYSQPIMEEYMRVLRSSKFNFDTKTIHGLIRKIFDRGIKLVADPSDVQLTDRTDQPFFDLVTTKSAGVPLLVTGNLRHYPRCHFVVSPRGFYLRGGVMRAGRP